MRIDFEAISKSLQPFKDSDENFCSMPKLTSYLDYRDYLKDYYHYKKNQNQTSVRPYSYSVFSAAANIKSPNYLKLIIEGKRNLSEEMIVKFSKAIGLSKEEAKEFRVLVMYSQASDPGERNRFLRQLNALRVNKKIESGEIDQVAWNKVPGWVAWVLYALIDQKNVSFEISNLKKILRGKASENEITEAIDCLIQNGQLKRDESGQFVKGQKWSEMPQDIPSALIRKLQSELMYLGMESLFRDHFSEREFGILTLSLTKAEFEALKFQLRKLRKSVQKDNAVARDQTLGDRVYQLNLQLFPVTNPSTLDN